MTSYTIKRIKLNIAFLCLTQLIYAQSGPGGVGNSSNMGLWLKAHTISENDGTSISSWADASGNANNAAQATAIYRPQFYSTSSMNSMPVVRFDKTDDYLRIENAAIFSGTVGVTWFAATRLLEFSSSLWPIISKRTNTSNANYSFFAFTNERMYLDIESNNNRFNTSTSVSNNNNYLMGFSYDGSKSNPRSKILMNGSVTTGNENNTTLSNANHPLTIGAINEGDGRHSSFELGEIMHFNYALTDVEIAIVSNYLSAKYNLGISGSLYDHSATHSGDVIGIGQASDGSNHTNSRGDGVLTVSNPSALSNGEFLFVGHNKQTLEYTETCALPEIYGKQLKRVWRVTETGDLGTVNLEFDLTGLVGLGAESELALVISSSASFTNATVHTTGRNLTGDTLSFSGVNLNDGDYFTIAQEGISFSAGVWHKGSGAGNAPNATDGNKKVYIADVGAQIAIDASCRCLHVDTGKDLTINSSKSIFVSDGIVNNGTITVKNTASIVQTASSNTNSGSGTYEVERTGINIDSAYNIWSSPIQSANILSTYPQTNPCDIYAFESNSQSWKWDYTVGFNTTCVGNPVTFQNQHVLAGGDGLMDVARGYFIPGSDINPTRTFSGQINNASIQKAVTLAANPGGVPWTGDHWNLVGNPYPSALNCHAFWQENAVNNSRISGALYFWDQDTILNYNQNDYAVWSPLGVVAGPNTAKTPNNNIASGQGFWVIADVNSNLVFNNSMRSDTNNMFFKREANEVSKLWLSLSNAEREYNEILIGFPQDATNGVDRLYDAPKMESANKLYLASRIGNKDFVVQGSEPVNFLDNKREIQLHIKTNEEGNYQIQIEKAEFMAKIKVFLYDATLDSLHALKQGAYSFMSMENTNDTTRFTLVFEGESFVNENGDVIGGGGPELGLEEMVSRASYKVFVKGDELHLEANGKARIESVQIFDIQGKEVVYKNIGNTQKYTLSNLNLQSGLYLVRLRDKYREETVKVVIP
jgi:hypothetical protein